MEAAADCRNSPGGSGGAAVVAEAVMAAVLLLLQHRLVRNRYSMSLFINVSKQ